MDNMSSKFRLPQSLLDAVKNIQKEETEYQMKVKALMKKKGITSLGQLSPDEKKAFFNTLDSMHKAKNEEVELDESKSSTGYNLYHKDFSSAMSHAYDFAKQKYNIEIDPTEIDRNVAMGPKKPSSGKANAYRLLDKTGKKAIQVQVTNLDNKRYELNMYKEEVELEEQERDLPFTPDKKKSNPGVVPGKRGVGPSIAKHLAKMAMKKQMDKKKPVKEEVEELTESHFKVGQRVECIRSGMKGTVTKVDKPEEGKYYTVKQDSGKVMKYAPDELKALKEMKEEIDEGMSAAQIDKLRQEYGKIKGIDPASDNYKKLTAMLDKLDLKTLQSLAGAKIKFVSSLAQNRVIRKMNEEKTVGAKKEATGNEKPVKKGEKVSGKQEPITIDPEVDEKK